MPATFSVRLDDALRARLEKEAKAEERSLSFLVQKALTEFLDTKEQKRAAIEAAYQGAHDETEFISGERMSAWVASWGTDQEGPEPIADVKAS